MLADPYFQMCHVFNLESEPLLKDGEHYSEYWIRKGIYKVAAIRSPIVHHSEVNLLNFKDSVDTRKWYKYIHSGIIYPANGIGIDDVVHGGSDKDGDLVCTINSPTMIKGKIHGLPIVYESMKSAKVIVDSRDDKSQVEGQLVGYNSKVGFATNISSSMYALLEEFPWGSIERETILKRLKIGRAIQGEIIDGVKGLQVPEFRNHWTKYKKVTPDMTPEESEKWEFNNRILCEVRPSYFRFLYQKYMSIYNKELKSYDTFAQLLFGRSFSDIVFTPESTEESELIARYKWNSFFLDNNSVVNKISRYMRGALGLVGKFSTASSRDFDYKLLTSKYFRVDGFKLSQMEEILQAYKSFKRGLWHKGEDSFESMDAFIQHLKKESVVISSDESELASYAVLATYQGEVSQLDFAWRLFPDGILQNITSRSSGTIKFPVADPLGSTEYLWNRYSIVEVSLEEINGRS
jgi:hypothetical protein